MTMAWQVLGAPRAGSCGVSATESNQKGAASSNIVLLSSPVNVVHGHKEFACKTIVLCKSR